MEISQIWELLLKVIKGYSKYPMKQEDWANYTAWVEKKKAQLKEMAEKDGSEQSKDWVEDFDTLAEIAAKHIYADQVRLYPHQTY